MKRVCRIRFGVILAVLFFSLRAWSLCGLKPGDLCFSERSERGYRVIYNGMHYARPGGQPVVVISGFMGTDFNGERIGKSLYADPELNADVYFIHLRGQGAGGKRPGTHLSFVDGYPEKGFFRNLFRWMNPFKSKKDSRNFVGDLNAIEYMTEDIYHIVERIYRMTGKPVILVGHSMGGLAAILALSGFDFDDKGRVFINDQKRDAFRKMVKLAAPVDPAIRMDLAFPEPIPFLAGAFLQYYRATIKPMIGKGRVIPFSFKNALEIDEIDGLVDKVLHYAKKESARVGTHYTPFSKSFKYANRDNIHRFSEWLIKGLGSLSTDAAERFMEYIAEGDPYVLFRSQEIAHLMIGAENDWLTPGQNISEDVRQTRERGNKGGIMFALLKKRGHVTSIAEDESARVIANLVSLANHMVSDLGKLPDIDLIADPNHGTVQRRLDPFDSNAVTDTVNFGGWTKRMHEDVNRRQGKPYTTRAKFGLKGNGAIFQCARLFNI